MKSSSRSGALRRIDYQFALEREAAEEDPAGGLAAEGELVGHCTLTWARNIWADTLA